MSSRYSFLVLALPLAAFLGACDAASSETEPTVSPPQDPVSTAPGETYKLRATNELEKPEGAQQPSGDMPGAPKAAAKPAPAEKRPPPLPRKWASHALGLPFTLGYETGAAKSKATGKPAMFFVTTTWCGWCKKLAKENFTDPEIKKLLESFVLVLVDGDRERTASRRLGARGFPHIVFRSSGERVLEICQGYKPKAHFKRIVERAIEAAKKSK